MYVRRFKYKIQLLEVANRERNSVVIDLEDVLAYRGDEDFVERCVGIYSTYCMYCMYFILFLYGCMIVRFHEGRYMSIVPCMKNSFLLRCILSI